ncbi:cytochrome c oxidase accessory protein CcoG [Synoicihabitans lomoniglobus]|uniref:Cytochrome c oxidase accessory protein CcoG n=1 Tax=Synoicihabitans lomoniglobus TaxID=2909285 RepID=A0AAE9ZSW9_9BACT|nr:cytochrome c oxidase accessory protein CcoG [Opitutaceae bacterium LMO-M01]WED63552.1 cytochrome c oxidase accessory protein CcoG [Opitutaceae bacterium LMO-M01]
MPKPSQRPSIDTVTTIRDDGSRFFLHPADVKGFFTRHRRWTGLLLIAIYLSLPWIKIGGHPAVFLDIGGRRFHLMGLVLAFQDAWLLFFAITGLGFSLFFITSLLGRLWCGWACPQTVFLEHVYRRIERWIEGDAVKRRKLDAAPWDVAKIAKRGGKQVAFVIVSAVISHLFLAYYVSIPELWDMMGHAPAEHWGAFVFVFLFTGAIYFNFAWFREQLCIVICPYGRLQSALTDDNTMVIGYDADRGEPRGKVGTPDVGSCIDCNRCVQVCPTGIDIRQGLQLECIGCAACIDACDDIMTKVKRPTGLIRYDSLVGLEGGKTRWMRPRTIMYSILLLVGMSVATFAISTVRPASFGVTRIPGAPYIVSDTAVRNQFLVRVVNKRDTNQSFTLELRDGPASLERTGFTETIELSALGEKVVPLVLQVPRSNYDGRFHLLVVLRDEAGSYTVEREVEFVGPDPKLLREDTP